MVPWKCSRNRFGVRSVSGREGLGKRVAPILGERVRMIHENQVRMTGSLIASLIWTLLVSTLLFALTGCGGGGDSGGEGRIKVSVTDAPIDDASSVVVQFSGVAFKREGEAAEIVRNLSPSAR